MKKKYVRILIYIVCLVGIIAGYVWANQDGRPQAVVEHPVYDFGEVYAGESIYHEFTLRNTGDAPLEITSVKTT